jgi:hypothetical protein
MHHTQLLWSIVVIGRFDIIGLCVFIEFTNTSIINVIITIVFAIMNKIEY